jgi:hypothetical protein
MAKREGISKKVRFELFKRDKFTCQYCGKSAPEITLEIDHIKPIAKGGDNNLLNLITSCYDCNRGKRDRKISDDTILKKQKTQLDEIAERREQLTLLAKWREELLKYERDTVDLIIENIESLYKNKFFITEYGKPTIKTWLKKYSIKEILEAIDISSNQYLKNINKEAVDKFFAMIPKIAYNRKLFNQEPFLEEIFKMCHICSNKFRYSEYYKYKNILLKYYINFKEQGVSVDKIKTELYDIIEKSSDYYDWCDNMERKEKTNG